MGVRPSLGHRQPAQSPPPLPHPVNPVVLLSDKSVLVPPSIGFPQRPEHRLGQPSRPSRTGPWWLLPPSSHSSLPLQQDKNVSASRLCTSCSLCLELYDCHLATSFSSARTPPRSHSSEGPSLVTLPKHSPTLPTAWAQQHLVVPTLLSSLWVCCPCPMDWWVQEGRGHPESPGLGPAGCSVSSRRATHQRLSCLPLQLRRGQAYTSLGATRRDHGGSWGRKTQAGLEKQLGAEARRG